MKFAIILGDMYPAGRVVKCGILAEKHGFDLIYIPDHIVDIDGARVDCWILLGAIGARTKRIMLGPGVMDIHHIIPAKAAQMTATLDELTNGRAILGLGTGELMNLKPFGIEFESPKDRIDRISEYIDVVKLLWSSDRFRPVSYQGRFYSLSEAFIDQKHVRKPHPPVHVGAMRSKRLLRLIGEKAEGWISWIMTPEAFKERVKVLMESASKHGRDQIEAVAWLYTCITEDEKAERAALSVGKIYLYVEKRMLEERGYKVDIPNYTYLLANKPFKTGKELVKAASWVPEEMVREVTAIGGIERCVEMVEKYAKAGATCIGFRIMSVEGALSIEESIELLSKKVVSYFRSGD